MSDDKLTRGPHPAVAQPQVRAGFEPTSFAPTSPHPAKILQKHAAPYMRTAPLPPHPATLGRVGGPAIQRMFAALSDLGSEEVDLNPGRTPRKPPDPLAPARKRCNKLLDQVWALPHLKRATAFVLKAERDAIAKANGEAELQRIETRYEGMLRSSASNNPTSSTPPKPKITKQDQARQLKDRNLRQAKPATVLNMAKQLTDLEAPSVTATVGCYFYYSPANLWFLGTSSWNQGTKQRDQRGKIPQNVWDDIPADVDAASDQYGKCCAEVDALRQLYQRVRAADLTKVRSYAFYGKSGTPKSPCAGCQGWMDKYQVREMHA